MSMPAPLPAAQNQVPNIADLSEQLGFVSMADRHALQTSTHQWRRAYKCGDGTLGKDLTDWKSAYTQGRLRVMTQSYLNDAENGKKFWPLKTHPTHSALEWPTDSRKITMLVQQLFWRQNVNEARNAKNPARQHDRSVSSDANPIVFTTPWGSKSSTRNEATSHRPQGDRTLYPPVRSTIKPVPRPVTSSGSPKNDANSLARSVEEMMSSSSDSEPIRRTRRTGRETSNKSSPDVFEFYGSDREVAGEYVSEHTPASPVPIAKMIPDIAPVRDPNFAFDAAPSVEPPKRGSSPNQSKTSKKRKRVRRIGSRVGSEDDDETYTPSKPKQKRVTSPKSASSTLNSGSSKTSAENKDTEPNADATPAEEGRSLHRGSVTYEKLSSHNSTNPLERFKPSRQGLRPLNSYPNLSQDSLASTSQSQRTIDIAQQYPEIGEHMHTFPAEHQVASMSPTKPSESRKINVVLSEQDSPSLVFPSRSSDISVNRQKEDAIVGHRETNDKSFQDKCRDAGMHDMLKQWKERQSILPDNSAHDSNHESDQPIKHPQRQSKERQGILSDDTTHDSNREWGHLIKHPEFLEAAAKEIAQSMAQSTGQTIAQQTAKSIAQQMAQSIAQSISSSKRASAEQDGTRAITLPNIDVQEKLVSLRQIEQVTGKYPTVQTEIPTLVTETTNVAQNQAILPKPSSNASTGGQPTVPVTQSRPPNPPPAHNPPSKSVTG